jgi:hypothetical protein
MIYVYAFVSELPRGDGLIAIRAGKLVVAAAKLDARPAPDEAGLRAHDAIVRRLWDAAEAVLPVRFGAVFADEAAARAEITAQREPLEEALELVRGCAQMTLRVAAEEAAEPADGGPGTRYLLARARAQKAPEIDALRPALAPLVRAERSDRKSGVVSVFHLVPRAQVAAYREAVANFRAIVSGPFPPYAFAPEELA